MLSCVEFILYKNELIFLNILNILDKEVFLLLHAIFQYRKLVELSPLIINLNVVEDVSTIKNWPMLLAIAVKHVKVIALFDKVS